MNKTGKGGFADRSRHSPEDHARISSMGGKAAAPRNGNKFTSETARAAALKRAQMRREQSPMGDA